MNYQYDWNTMSEFIVGYLSFSENDMKLKHIKAMDWREAIKETFPDMEFITEEPDLDCALEMAFNSDTPMQVLEI